MADLITALGNRDRILIDDFSIAQDTAYSSQKVEDLIKTFDSVVTCLIPLAEPAGTEGIYDTAYLSLLAGEIGERVLVTAQNGLGVVTAENGTAYTIKTVYVCTWEALTGKPFETLSALDFTVGNGELRYADKWTAPVAAVEAAKQDKVPESGSAGTGRYAGKRDPVTGESVWEELDEFSLVNSVNGIFPENMPFGKNVRLDGTKINLDDAAGTPVTVKEAVISLSSAALTDAAAANTLPVSGLVSAVLQTVRNCLKWLVARFDGAGNANSAVKLATARTIQTNLAASTAASFDGTANAAPGVTGTLPLANGGTGRTDGKSPALVTPRTIALSGKVTGTATAFDGSANIAVPVTAVTADSCTGNAATATAAATAAKLATARTIQTNLGSAAAASFDGSANASPGVTGTLPLANGGTGRTDGKSPALVTPRTIALSGKVTGTATAFDGSANIAVPVTAVTADSCTGNAATATAAATADKLATARTIQTNLGSAAAASFDGTANASPGVTGILPAANGGTGNNSGSAFLPPGIIVHTAVSNPASQRLLPLEGQTISIAEGTIYENLAYAVAKGTGTGIFYINGNVMRLPDYRGLFLRGSGSQTFTDYDYSGTHNGGNIGDKHGDAIRNITGYVQNISETFNSAGTASGAFVKISGYPAGGTPDSPDETDAGSFYFNASRVVPVDSTNHPAFGVGRICISY